jgi:hypothetical protein
MRKHLIAVLTVSACGALLAPGVAAGQTPSAAGEAPDSNAVMRWNANAGEAAITACLAPTTNPLHESRMYAIMHIAIHDALNAIDRRYQPYLAGLPKTPAASPAAAVAAAAHDTLVASIAALPPAPPSCVTSAQAIPDVDADYSAALAAIPDGPAKTKGIALGQASAAAILAARAGDGSDTPLLDFAYPQGTQPGEYVFTPPFTFAFAPGWAKVTPFILKDATQFRPGPPYALDSKKYAADVNEVKRLGGCGLLCEPPATTPSDRTAEQTEIALFWVESSPLQWNRIARKATGQKDLNLWKSARLFALLNMAMADGYISSWDTKYLYNFWRPITAIRAADTDGNPATTPDPTWTPLVTTPPIPDHDSAHSVEGATAGEVMKRLLGDNVHFSTCSLTLPAGSTCADPHPVLRTYNSFTQAENENGLSRILVGFHFRHAVNDGLARGRKVGDRAVDRYLQPA